MAEGATWAMGDFNNDGKVNDKDAAIMAALDRAAAGSRRAAHIVAATR